MKKTKTTFLLAEICLGILLLFCVHLIFEDEKPQKRVAVIVEKSGDEKWNSFMNGLKQAAGIANIHLIICNTDEIENAEEEKNLIYDQLDNQVDAFIVQAAPGRDTIDMLREIRVQKPMLLVANDERNRRAEENGSSNGRGTRQEVRTTGRTKNRTRRTRAEGSAQIGPFAVLH